MGIRLGGLESGLDTAKLIEALLSAERRPLALVEQQKKEFEANKLLFTDLGKKLTALRDAAASLDNRSRDLTGASAIEEFLAYKASSSDEAVVRGRAFGSASPGATALRVVQLAAPPRRVSNAFASDSAVIANAGDTLSIDFGGASPIAITVGAAGASLSELASLINADPNNTGAIRAQVVFDGAGYRLLVQGSQTGAANNATLTTTIAGPGGAAFTDGVAGQDATDARLELFGLAITRASNTVTDVLPGVTLELLAVSATPVQVQVARDDAAIATKLETFITAYNEVASFIRINSNFDPATKKAGALFGDQALRTIATRLSTAFLKTVGIAGNPLTGLINLGVSLKSDRTLELDRTKLASVLDANLVDARQLLGGDGVTDGVLVTLSKALDGILDVSEDPTTHARLGLLIARKDSIDSRIKAFSAQIERLELRLAAREKLLVAQFSRMEALLAQLRSQGSALNGLSSTNSSTR